MGTVTRNIGLSLGADVCWPIAYEQILERLDLAIPHDGDTVRFHCERVTIEPFDLRQPTRYDVVIDRLTHWYTVSREWIKKAVILDGLYVYNNPWAVQSMHKHTTYCAMIRLGLPIPETWLVPPKSYDVTPDLEPTLQRYAKLFDLPSIGDALGYPHFMKPYDGGAWVGVSRIADAEALTSAYEDSGRLVMHLQRAVDPWDRFVRGIGLGPQVRKVLYDPGAPHHDRYRMESGFLSDEDAEILRSYTLTINAFFGWDFNSCESLRGEDRVWRPIDFANPCPDSQVTSLHYHFPWVIKANLRWSIFAAATRRPFRQNLHWAPYFEIADTDMPFRDKLRAYTRLANEHFETERFQEFCDDHLAHLDEVTWEWFGTEVARDAVRQKVTAIFPEHEVEEFTEVFWQRLQRWRDEFEAGVSPDEGLGTVPQAEAGS